LSIISSEVNTRIRFLLGGLPTSVLSDEVLNFIIDQNITKYGDVDENLCIVTYQSLVEALQYLDRRSKQESAASGVSGSVSTREEVLGKRRIKIQYSTGNEGGKSVSWAEILSEFIEDPSLVCDSLAVATPDKALVLIGGVSQKEYSKVKNDSDSRNGLNSITSCNPNITGGRNTRRGYRN
jgi:hypothetical protein